MSVVVVGLNHRTAPVGLLERLTIADERLPKALHHLSTFDHVLEAVVLSTCNRVEVYAAVSKFHAGTQDLRNFLSEFCHVAPEDFADHLYSYHDEAAIRHLFRVAAGIDSMVLGESEILGQVRRAFQSATDEAMVQRVLGAAFRKALRVGKRVRTETYIGHNPVSISSAAVELARKAWPGETLAGKRVSIVGAGKMGRLAAQALRSAGARDVTVVNRSEERGQGLAELFDATARPWSELADALASSDIVICSTTAPVPVLDKALIESVMAVRGTASPLFVVDIAVPRDVDPAAKDVPGVVLRDIDDLRGVVETNLGSRLDEVGHVEEIVTGELEKLMEWERATEIAPTIAALVARGDDIRITETERVRRQLGALSDEQRRAVELLTHRIVAKLLHPPLEKAKDLASSKQGHLYLTALRELFELDDEPDE
jgi:glutamyl-tRNA reductase